MDFGMPTLLETKTLEECAALCSALGLRFIELNMNLPQYQPDNIDTELFRDIAKRYGVYYTIHLDENLNPCDFNSLVRKAYVQTALQTIEMAKAIQAPVVNMHLHHGVHFKLPGEKAYLFDAYLDTYLGSLREFQDACEKAVGDSGIMICVENTDGHHYQFAQKALALLLKSPVFALTYDIGHNFCIGGGDEQIILHYRDRLRHMHMHDAAGIKCHLALGDGEIDIPQYAALAEELDLRVVLETKTAEGLRRSVEYVRGMLGKMTCITNGIPKG